ncbi:DUF2254 domain-containing protein [Lignipirellula cremea]|uniref:DUF2254 domain-containing protein n=1 Tax=Lignipirellula cremea TaxID=2528010 RepID=A0A518E0Z7_9BACT|nr:DUF2254 domain-containing protein [Lignipirellula cremea]QDU97760.1 hypothetical protein Pla8534_56160 [Lignipirellula cremea]
MNISINTWLDWARGSLWLTPATMTLLAVLLAYASTEIDQRYGSLVIEAFPWVQTTSQAARSSLSALAGALITVSGVVVSITVVSLSVTASQFGSRLLRTVLRDRVTQLTLGGLLASSLYCLLVLSAVREDEAIYVPHLSVALALVLASFNLGMLIYFTHNIGSKIQAPVIIHTAAEDLGSAVARLFPEKLGEPAEKEETEQLKQDLGGPRDLPSFRVETVQQGYIQAIDAPSLFEMAKDQRLVVRLGYRPGDFMVKGRTLAEVWQDQEGEACDHKELADQIQGAFILSISRTPVQDVEYAFNELVEIALRALSPGINDSFTAITCIDWITANLRKVAEGKSPTPYRREDDNGSVRLIAQPFDFVGLVASALDPIRRCSTTNLLVSLHLLKALGTIGESVSSEEQADALRIRAEIVAETFLGPDTAVFDQQQVIQEHKRATAVLARKFPDLQIRSFET